MYHLRLVEADRIAYNEHRRYPNHLSVLKEHAMKNRKMAWGVAVAVAAVGQMISAIFFYNCADNAALTNLGWAVMMVSAIFGWLPILTFRRRGGVAKGESYIQTTQLVDTGIYGIVRHPQYLAGIIISVALMLIAPHWLVIGLGVVATLIYAFSTFEEERDCIEKFGDAYREYQTRVPRLNAIVGIIRALKRWATRDVREKGQM
jgi:protein-S-isoprenylcysteine O-methyltransferase Ste14